MSVPDASVLDLAGEIIAAFVADSFSSDRDLVDLLNRLQQALGYIPPPSIALIADVTGLERPAIYRAIELSPSFSLRPPGKHLLYICSADNCCAKGGLALADTAKRVLGADYYQCDARNTVRIEPFRCLGNCVNGPNISLDRIVQGPMTPEKLEGLLQGLLGT
jgi:NADH:ubiquinone oxidoreductase subunit E